MPGGFGLVDYYSLVGMIFALGALPTSVVGPPCGTTVILELYRRHPGVVRSMVLAAGYAGWRGSLGAEEADARLATVRAELAESHEAFDPTVPGLFAGDPPARLVPLMQAMAADVRRQSMVAALSPMALADLTDVVSTVQVLRNWSGVRLMRGRCCLLCLSSSAGSPGRRWRPSFRTSST